MEYYKAVNFIQKERKIKSKLQRKSKIFCILLFYQVMHCHSWDYYTGRHIKYASRAPEIERCCWAKSKQQETQHIEVPRDFIFLIVTLQNSPSSGFSKVAEGIQSGMKMTFTEFQINSVHLHLTLPWCFGSIVNSVTWCCTWAPTWCEIRETFFFFADIVITQVSLELNKNWDNSVLNSHKIL